MLPLFVDMPPIQQERVLCSIYAAVKNDVPVNIILAVAEKENGKPGQWVKNTNGSYDIGPMQFNTAYLKDLNKYGINTSDVSSGCYPYDLAAWRIRNHIDQDHGSYWTKVANYHSKTSKYNEIYRKDLVQKSLKWAEWVDLNFESIDKSQQLLKDD